LHSHDGNEEKGKKLFKTWNVLATLPRSYSVFLPVQYNVDVSLFNITTHARSRREQTRTTHIISTVFIRHFRHDECFSISRLFFHAHVPLRLLSPFLLYPTRQSVLRPDPAVPRSANCLGSILLFYPLPLHPRSVHSTSYCTLSPRPLIDTFRSGPAYIFSNPTLI
jgi:hypothetical protein